MDNKNSGISDFLINRDIKPTANRILVAKELMEMTHPVSLADLEGLLYPMDKASIFRVLELFASKDVVHVIEDGSRSSKYEICLREGHHDVSDQHVHFYCEKCKETFCMEDINVPRVEVPRGYVTRSVNYVLKGFCPSCSGSQEG